MSPNRDRDSPSAAPVLYNFCDEIREGLLSQQAKAEQNEGGFYDVEAQQGKRRGCCAGVRERLKNGWDDVAAKFRKAWEFCKSDPRKVMFSVKMGMALSLVSLLMFIHQPYKEISTYSIWAILTVVVVFEFTVGATLSKGFNRGLGTFSAGGLAFGVAELAMCTGNWEPVIFIVSIFTAGAGATFAKLYPKMKPYEYGFRVFLITFCFILVSGYRTRAFIHTAITRFILIVIGATVAFVINGCFYPIWAGEDLHKLIVKNFRGVASSLEGCIDGYLSGVEVERVCSKILTCQAADDPVYNAYRSVVVSATQEETLEGFASWEWPHGNYRMMKYPWKQYVKVGGALRHCAYMVMALHGCLLSEIQAPRGLRQIFSNELRRVSAEGASVLRELSNNLDNMTKLRGGEILHEVHKAAEELQKKIDTRSYLLVNSESWVIGNRHNIIPSEIDDKVEDEERDQLGNLSNQMSNSLQWPHENDRLVNVLSRSWDSHGSHFMTRSLSVTEVPEKKFHKQLSWPSQYPVDFDQTAVDHRDLDASEKTYESASALSLATFASLLIEFVARLDNLVISFNELSIQAKFKEPDAILSTETKGICKRLSKLLRL
uniref:TSA: Wollemia nobilis Ref_Wollemi_Transcript_5216_2472 transcribed RNA sequence n=1 Tax=Wollemia nobilis TaxID=56998 RepID=A0A0C9SA27_9CONI